MDVIKGLLIAGIRNYDTKAGELGIDFDKLIENESFQLICGIKAILEEEKLTDFECIDKIVDIFSEYEIDITYRHDY